MWRRLALAMAAATTIFHCSSFGSSGGTTIDDAGAGRGDGADPPSEECATLNAPGAGPVVLSSEAFDCGGRGFFLRDDGANCGACRHVCAGGCTNGLCDPTELTTAVGIPAPLQLTAVDTASYYVIGWDPSGSQQRGWAVPKSGGPPRLVGPPFRTLRVVDDGDRLLVVHDDKGRIYWGIYDKIGNPAGFTFGEAAELTGFARRADDVIVTERLGGTVRQLLKDGGGATLVSGQPSPGSVVADPSHTAWLNMPRAAADDVDAGSGRLVEMQLLEQGRPTLQSGSIARPSGLTQDSAAYYFYEADSGEFRRLAKSAVADGVGTTIARWTTNRTAHAAFRIGEFVYFALGIDRTTTIDEIVRVPRCGGDPLRVAAPNEYGVAVGEDGIVWVSGVRVLKVAL